ncbi:EAL domain-containing protein [Telmatospirillum sp.]|uniref:bifunctional diguanylate cyclase/phosphodiesterase n=1 Tax=Telmatospirillum sp. TaxID=2079197 RepID=UPI00283EB855|nr:EAL domain-containing protein [Telmatospirillum sp.]MDR3438188.1 EAL domain-containing protein [Telmatospirillum sp.]
MERQSPLGIRAWLIFLSLFSAIPVFFFSGFTIYRLASSEEEALVFGLTNRAQAVAAVVEQRLGAMEVAASVLAQSDAALHDDIPALLDQASRLLKIMPEVRMITLIGGDGREIFSTAPTRPDTTIPEVTAKVFRSAWPVISDLYASEVAGDRVISINVPVLSDGRVTYCLRMSVLAQAFNRLLVEQDPASEGTIALISQNGTIIARNRLDGKFIGTKTSAEIAAAISENRQSSFDSVTFDGTQVKAAVATIGLANWTVVFGVPMATLNAKLNRSLWIMSIGGTFLLLIGLLASLWLARHLAGHVTSVANASAAFGGGEEPKVRRTGIRELDEMGAALDTAHAREERVHAALSESKTMEAQLARLVEDLRQSKAEVLDQSARSRTLLKIASDGIHILDQHGNLMEASESFLRMLGCDADEARRLNVTDWDVYFSATEVKERIHRLVREQSAIVFETKMRSLDGSVFPVEISCRGVFLNGSHYLYSSARDITERKAAEAQIQQLAFFDTLTKLPNRRLLLERLSQAKVMCHRNHTYGALTFIDVDNFKMLNDTQGHRLGDLLLREIGIRLQSCVREGDTVARLGGDEFVVMMENLEGDVDGAGMQAEAVVEKILGVLAAPYLLENHLQYSTVSLGITLFHDKEVSNDDLLKQADLAMYQAKAAGRNTRRFFDPVMQANLAAQSELESDLRRAVGGHGLFLYYQPQIDRDGRLVGAEGLLRWNHEKRGLVMPDTFIPVAETSSLILALGAQVLELACAQLVAWQDDWATRDLVLAVNVSARQFRHPRFVDEVKAILDGTGANPRLLKLELTESLLLQEIEDCVHKMSALERLGVSLSLDDFGTGYSSLAYLKRLPLSQIKIDRSFVRDVLLDGNDATIARTIILLGKSLGLGVIAEGVEEEEQWAFLLREGCDQAQGFLFGAPMPDDAFLSFARHRLGALAVGGNAAD